MIDKKHLKPHKRATQAYQEKIEKRPVNNQQRV